MAFTTLNLAALPVKFVAIPVLAGLAAGTGAVGAYLTAPTPSVTNSAATVAALPSNAATVAALPTNAGTAAPVAVEQATPAKPDAKPSCEKQTWPYLDNRCIARGSDPARKVRLVVAPRASDAAASAASSGLVTSDTVLRGPGVAPEANEQPVVKKTPKRSETRRSRDRNEFQRVYSVYSVPSAGSTKPVIVVHPLRRDAYSSRF